MANIVRTKKKATGGITPEEKKKMDAHTQLWIARAMRTTPIEPDKIIPAIKGMYEAAGLKEPRVVIVPSPLVMAFAYGAASAIWYQRKIIKKRTARAAANAATSAATKAVVHAAILSATYVATKAATRAATRDATRAATDDATSFATKAAILAATHDATYAATHDATYAATDDAARAAIYVAASVATDAATDAAKACRDLAGDLGIACAARWSGGHHSGNMWAPYDCYLTAFRDVLGLELKEYANYTHWEQTAIHGGFRVMHPEFCMVSDFPETLKIDAENRPHCENGPSHRWRDGWSLYYWHGVQIPAEWIEDKKSLTASMALTWPNIEQRRAACEIVGWDAILSELKARTIDKDDDPEVGELVEVDIPQVGKERFLRVQCGTGRQFALPVPHNMKTALQANSWTFGFDDVRQFIKPEVRT